MSAHSKIGPSSAKRWFNCPGSVALVATLPNPPSKYASEGTLAHMLAEELVTGKVNSLMLYERVGEVVKVDKTTNFPGFDIEITEEMVQAVEEYRDVIVGLLQSVKDAKRPAPIHSKTEVRLEGTLIDERLFGTADHLLYQKGNVLHVMDLKYGKGVVDADDNEQLMTYLVMAMDGEAGWAFAEVFAHIFQPRARHEEGVHRTARFTVPELRAFREKLVAATKAATAKPGAAFKTGDWCQSSFCPALKAGCPAAHGAMVKQAQVDFAVIPPTPGALPSADVLPIEQVAAALAWRETFDAAFKGYEERIQRELEAGKVVPGYKLVPGRSNRQWRDEAEVVAKFEPVLGDKVYEEPKVKSPAQLEKLVGKKAGVDDLTFKPDAPLRLAKDSDPRTAETANVGAAKAFAPISIDAAIPEAMSRGTKKEADVLLARVVATVEPSLEEELGLVAPKLQAIWPV